MERTHWTLTRCFDFFGTRPAIIRWGWSARNEATATVVLTLWTDQLCVRPDGTIAYDVRARDDRGAAGPAMASGWPTCAGRRRTRAG